MKELLRRLRFLLHRAEFERDLDEEMRNHLALSSEERGCAEAAGRQFGNVTLLKEESRAMWTFTFWEQFVQDIRYGLRTMAANPLFTAMAVLSLALGIGANTAIYSFMDAILLRALPVADPEELVVFNWHTKDFPPVAHKFSGDAFNDSRTGYTSGNFPLPALADLHASNGVLSSVFAFSGIGRLTVEVQGQAEMAGGLLVSGDFYRGLGVRPAVGRLIGEDDDRTGANVVVISYAWWQRRFAADPNVVGQSILVTRIPFTIIGVSSPGFFGVAPGRSPEIYVPIHSDALPRAAQQRFVDKNYYWVEMIGRLKHGIGIRQAQTALAIQFHHFVESTASNDKERADLPELLLQEGGSGIDSLRRQFSKPLLALMTMVGLILAIACANIANLLLARATARRREMAMRLSLGASRSRVVRQLLTESALLAAIGGLLGISMAVFGIRFITWLLANSGDNFTPQVGINLHVLGFTLCLALFTGILFGFAPALQATKVDVTPALKETRSSAARRVRPGLGHALVVSQIAISFLLVIGAGLFVRTLSNLESVELGFNRDHVLLFAVMARQSGYQDAALVRFYEDLRERFLAIPGVRNASLSSSALISDMYSSSGVAIPGAPAAGRPTSTWVLHVGPSFFTTMQIPILAGREIRETDTTGSPRVAVVNEAFVKQYFPGENPVGRQFGLGGKEKVPLEIVGVAKAARYQSLKRDAGPIVYVPYSQDLGVLNQVYFEVRTAEAPLALANTVRQIVQELGPRVPVFNVTTQSAQIDQTIVQERTFAELCTCFAALALMIACVGLYGTMAYAVARRTSEIGIRMALGAERHRIIWMVLREVFALSAAGLAIGLAVAWATLKFVESFLFGMKHNDPVSIGVSALVLIAAASLAGFAPAWKASRIDPMAALRHE
jgi:macrolide transport system ATP-binding/permease protein